MDQSLLTTPHSPAVGIGRVLTWLAAILCYGLLLSLIVSIARQILVPPPAHRVILVRTIPLPQGLKDQGAPDALEPGVAQDFDNFGFQAIDPTTHLLFIAHSGPVPFNYSFEDETFHFDDPADLARDGNILVFDLRKQQLVGRVPIPRVTGLVVAPDLHKVFASGSEENRIYSFDEPSLTNIHFLQLDEYDDPDTLSYDPVTRRLFVAAPGAHTRDIVKVPGLAQPIIQENTDPAKENVLILDALTLRVQGKINIGQLPTLPGEDLTKGDAPVPLTASHAPLYGYKVGQIKYNEVTHLIYLVTQVSPNENDRTGPIAPPGAAELVTIDPLTPKILHRALLPESCDFPHALELDPQAHIAYLDCTEVDADIPLVQHVVRMDLTTMKAFPDDPRQSMLAAAPSMLALDRPQHLLFEACAGGITVFDVRPGHFQRLGNYIIGHSTTSIIVDESTQLIYLPVTSAGGRPTLQIAKYNPHGV